MNPSALKPYEKRRTTDCLFLIGICAMWVVMTIVGAVSIPNGDPLRLVSPMDEKGRLCGVDPSVEDMPKFYYVTNFGTGVCVKDCPAVDATDYPVAVANYECITAIYDTYTTDAAVESYISGNCMDSAGTSYVFGTTGCYCNVLSASRSIFNRCIFTGSNDVDEDESDANASDYMKMWMSDIYTARSVIFGFGFVIALVFAFLFTYLMSIECVAELLVWGCIFGVLAIAVGMTGMAYSTLKEWKDEDPEQHTASQKSALEGFVWTLQIVCFLWFLLMCWMYKAIQVAIKCVVMGSTAIEEMPALVFFPILQIFGFCLFMVPWMFYALYIASDGEFKKEYATLAGNEVVVSRTWDSNDESNVSGKLWFMLFALLWTMNFISNFGALVISHSVATWYFTKPEERVEAINNYTIYESFKLCLRFHTGTVALGSFLIAAVQFMRAVALYIQKNTKQECRDQTWVKIVFCCVDCCLCMLECCMKFIAKHAYIQTAIHGTAFCPSAKNMFSLIARNLLRIGALTLTAELVMFIGKLFVTLLATGCSYFFLSGSYSEKLYDIVGPTIFVAILSWITATMFMDVLHMGVDTILHCFISDEEHNNGVPVFASDEMKGFVDNHGKMDDPGSQDNAAKDADNKT